MTPLRYKCRNCRWWYKVGGKFGECAHSECGDRLTIWYNDDGCNHWESKEKGKDGSTNPNPT